MKVVVDTEEVGSKVEPVGLSVKAAAEKSVVEAMDLPSNYLFYAQDAVTVRPFGWHEYILLGTAQEAGHFRSLAEAVCNTIKDHPGMTLTYGDFQYIMYHHRLQMQRPLKLDWECNNPEHLEWVKAGKTPDDRSIDEGSLKQYATVKRTDLEIRRPDEKVLENLIDNDRGELFPDLYVYPPTISDVISNSEEAEKVMDDMMESEDVSFAEVNRRQAQIKQTNRFAALLSTRHGATLKERRDYLDQWFANHPDISAYDVIDKLQRFDTASDHGVIESVKVKCGACGTERQLTLAFSPTDFFPEVPQR